MHLPLRSQRRARIEIIPLIDIIFFLLATFMMVSLSMVKNEGLPVRLPGAATAVPQERDDSVTLSITKEGACAWNRRLVTPEELAANLARMKAEHPDGRIFLHGDAAAPFGAVVSVLDRARQAGLSKIAIETEKPRP